MVGMKLIDASEVVTSKKTSKVATSKNASKVEIKFSKTPTPMKIITDDNQKDVVGSTTGIGDIVKPAIVDIVKSGVATKTDITDVTETNFGSRSIRAIKLKQDIYYGTKDANKKKFVRLYKKLGLAWMTDVSLDGVMVDGWFNSDKSQYIIKLLEEGDFKRFKFYGCDEIYDYFVILGGVVFEHDKEDSLSSNYKNNNINNAGSIKENQISDANQKDGIVSNVGGAVGGSRDIDENYRFIGADLWSGYRTRQLLKRLPDDLGIIWK